MLPYTFSLAYLCSLIDSTAVKVLPDPFQSGSSLRQFLQYVRLHSIGWIAYTIRFAYPYFQKITHAGSMTHFPIHKGYSGKPCIIQVYQACGASRIKNNTPPDTRDALGLSPVYPRPDEPFSLYTQYTITKFNSQHIWIKPLYNGLPVHALAQTGKPLFAPKEKSRAADSFAFLFRSLCRQHW